MAHTGAGLDITQKTDGLANSARLTPRDFSQGHAGTIADYAFRQGKTHFLIYVHGAPLLRYKDVSELRTLLRTAKTESGGAYPVFFNWKGSLSGAYTDQLWNVRQGQEIQSRAMAALNAVASFSADAAGIVPSAVTAPLRQARIWNSQQAWSNTRQFVEFRHRQLAGAGGWAHITAPDGAYRHLGPVDLLLVPSRLLRSAFGAAFIQPFGASSWRNYRRRANAAVFRTDDYNAVSRGEYGSGALALLVREIESRFRCDGAAPCNQSKPLFTVIAHSTGAIIAADLVAAFPNVSFRRIVFLGAAATVSDFNTKIVPYLRNNPAARFYNLSLHSAIEARASRFYGPQGSVLEWIDNHLTRPAGETDRVIGKWDNVVTTAHTIDPCVQGQVWLSRLPLWSGEAGNRMRVPRNHAELGSVLGDYSPFCERCWVVKDSWGSDMPCRRACEVRQEQVRERPDGCGGRGL